MTAIAGNIIPAIATANAMIAGLVILLTFRVLAEDFKRMQSVYLRQKANHRNQLLVPERKLSPANPLCYVCSHQPTVTVGIDTNNMTVKEFESEILKNSLHMIAPDAMLQGQSLVVISSEEGETEQNNDKKLKELGIVDGSILKVDDFLQNYELTVNVNHYEAKAKDDPPFMVICNSDELKAKKDDVNGSDAGNGNSDQKMEYHSDDDDLCVVEENECEPACKKMKIDDNDDLIMIE